METQKNKHRLDMEVSGLAGGKKSKQKSKRIKMASRRMGGTENMGDFVQA